MTRGGWAMARVNMFLKMKRGGKVKESYRKADQDISKSSEIEDSEAANRKDKEKNKKKKSYSSLWENIRNKKKRMGKNYKPAKPGDKDRPEKKAWDKAKSSEEDEKKNFKPHKMYDPKTGKAYDAKTYEDHLKMKKMGYTHEGPKEKSEAYKSSKKNKKKGY